MYMLKFMFIFFSIEYQVLDLNCHAFRSKHTLDLKLVKTSLPFPSRSAWNDVSFSFYSK